MQHREKSKGWPHHGSRSTHAPNAEHFIPSTAHQIHHAALACRCRIAVRRHSAETHQKCRTARSACRSGATYRCGHQRRALGTIARIVLAAILDRLGRRGAVGLLQGRRRLPSAPPASTRTERRVRPPPPPPRGTGAAEHTRAVSLPNFTHPSPPAVLNPSCWCQAGAGAPGPITRERGTAPRRPAGSPHGSARDRASAGTLGRSAWPCARQRARASGAGAAQLSSAQLSSARLSTYRRSFGLLLGRIGCLRRRRGRLLGLLVALGRRAVGLGAAGHRGRAAPRRDGLSGAHHARLQKMQNPTGAACAAAPRSLQTLARAESLRAASGRFLKSLGQKHFFLTVTRHRRSAFSAAWPTRQGLWAAGALTTSPRAWRPHEGFDAVPVRLRAHVWPSGQSARASSRFADPEACAGC